MSKIINITDKLCNERPKIQIGEKLYEVNDSMAVVLKIEELAAESTTKSMTEALELALGEQEVKEIGVDGMPVGNFKVLFTAILAAIQGISYEEAAARFQKG